MKKILVIISILAVTLPFHVTADAFKDGTKNYELTKREVSCAQDIEYQGTLTDGTLVYIAKEAKTIADSFYTVGQDNTCKKLTTEEIINLIPEMNYYYYYTAFEIDNTTSINREIEIMYDEGYYQNDRKYYTLVENLTATEFLAGTYYEFANFTISSTATIDPNTTYYSYEGSVLYKEVENPIAENILNYTVITTQSVREKELLKL